MLPKIHKHLENATGRPVISNYGAPTEKVSEFLDSQLKSVRQSSRSYIKDSGDFMRKIKNISTIPNGSILVTADVARLYPSILHEAGLRAQEKALNNRPNKNLSTVEVVHMTCSCDSYKIYLTSTFTKTSFFICLSLSQQYISL